MKLREELSGSQAKNLWVDVHCFLGRFSHDSLRMPAFFARLHRFSGCVVFPKQWDPSKARESFLESLRLCHRYLYDRETSEADMALESEMSEEPIMIVALLNRWDIMNPSNIFAPKRPLILKAEENISLHFDQCRLMITACLHRQKDLNFSFTELSRESFIALSQHLANFLMFMTSSSVVEWVKLKRCLSEFGKVCRQIRKYARQRLNRAIFQFYFAEKNFEKAAKFLRRCENKSLKEWYFLFNFAVASMNREDARRCLGKVVELGSTPVCDRLWNDQKFFSTLFNETTTSGEDLLSAMYRDRMKRRDAVLSKMSIEKDPSCFFEEPCFTALMNLCGVKQCNLKSCRRKDRKLKKCAVCNSVFYCSVKHQKSDWREHREVCKARAKRDFSLTLRL